MIMLTYPIDPYLQYSQEGYDVYHVPFAMCEAVLDIVLRANSQACVEFGIITYGIKDDDTASSFLATMKLVPSNRMRACIHYNPMVEDVFRLLKVEESETMKKILPYVGSNFPITMLIMLLAFQDYIPYFFVSRDTPCRPVAPIRIFNSAMRPQSKGSTAYSNLHLSFGSRFSSFPHVVSSSRFCNTWSKPVGGPEYFISNEPRILEDTCFAQTRNWAVL